MTSADGWSWGESNPLGGVSAAISIYRKSLVDDPFGAGDLTVGSSNYHPFVVFSAPRWHHGGTSLDVPPAASGTPKANRADAHVGERAGVAGALDDPPLG